MKKNALFALVFGAAIVLGGCSLFGNQDSSSDSFVGTWNITAVVVSGNTLSPSTAGVAGSTITAKSDNSFSGIFYSSSGALPGTWAKSGSTYTLTLTGTGISFTGTVSSDGKTFTLTYPSVGNYIYSKQ